MKQCKNGADCVHPEKQGDGWLPESEFYTVHRTGRLYSNCKACRKQLGKNTKQTNAKRRKVSGEPAEDATVFRLKQNGIHATIGRLSEFTHVDVVAWGCVRIEVKSSLPLPDKPGWRFCFYSQQKQGIKADLVVLVPLDENGLPVMFSVFPADCYKFFRPNGKMKAGVQVLVNPGHRKSGYTALTMQDMHDHEDDWGQIEVVRQQIGQRLSFGMEYPRRVTKPAERPLPLFDHKAG